MTEQLRIESPDFNRILSGDTRATHDAVKTLWLAMNEAFTRQFWIDVPFVAGSFTASSGTWTVAAGDVNLYRYITTDQMMLIEFALENTTTSSGMGANLYVATPNYISAQNTYNTGFVAAQGNIDEIGMISTRSGANATSVSLTRADGSNWPSSVTDDLDIHGMIVLEL